MSPSSPDGAPDRVPPTLWQRVSSAAVLWTLLSSIPVTFGLVALGLAALARHASLVDALGTDEALAVLVAVTATGILFLVDGCLSSRAKPTIGGIGTLVLVGVAGALRLDDPLAGRLHHVVLQACAVGVVFAVTSVVIVLCDVARGEYDR